MIRLPILSSLVEGLWVHSFFMLAQPNKGQIVQKQWQKDQSKTCCKNHENRQRDEQIERQKDTKRAGKYLKDKRMKTNR